MTVKVVYQATATDLQGNALDTATITVTRKATGLPTILFSDEAGTPLVNPFTSDSNGYFQFYCDQQVVSVKAEKDGFSQTFSDVFLNVTTLDSSNDSNVDDAAVTPLGYNARRDYDYTQNQNITGEWTFGTINIDEAYANRFEAGTAEGTNDVSGDIVSHGQLGVNSTLAMKDLTLGGLNYNLANINGVLQWNGNNILTSENGLNVYFLNPTFTSKTQRYFGEAVAADAPFNRIIVPLSNWNKDPTSYSGAATNYEVRDPDGTVMFSGVFTTDCTLDTARSSNTYAVFIVNNHPLALTVGVTYEVYMLGNGNMEIT